MLKEGPWFVAINNTVTSWAHLHLRGRCKRQTVKGKKWSANFIKERKRKTGEYSDIEPLLITKR